MSGCASIIDGTSQDIAFDTNPPGGVCELERNGEILGRVSTPGTIHVKKTKHDINVTCTKEGYLPSTAYVNSDIQDATWGNIILGGGIGWAVDSARGADNKYEGHITVTLNPDLGKVLGAEAETAADGVAAVGNVPETVANDGITEEPTDSTEVVGGIVEEASGQEDEAKETADEMVPSEPLPVEGDENVETPAAMY